MTDGAPGPGWWLASDGRWYAPSSHPDPTHRARWASAPVAGQAVSELPTEGVPVLPSPFPAPTAPAPAPAPAVPVPSVVPMPPVPRPPEQWPAPASAAPVAAARPGNLAAGVVAGVASLLACGGTFLAWVEASTPAASLARSGWQIGADGRITLAVGLVAAAIAGLALAGLRHLALKVVLALGAVLLLAVFVVELIDVLDLRDGLRAAVGGSSVEVGLGLWAVGAAGALLAVATALERSRIRIPRR